MVVRRPALVDDGYQSGILAEGFVRELRGPRTRVSTGAAPAMFGVSRTGLRPRRAKRLAKPDGADAAKEHPGHARAMGSHRKRREGARVSANRLVVELAIEALDRREWPRTELEIQLLRSSMFAAQAIARDMIAAGRESEIDEISRNISEIAPDLPYKTPGLAQPDLRPPASPDDAVERLQSVRPEGPEHGEGAAKPLDMPLPASHPASHVSCARTRS